MKIVHYNERRKYDMVLTSSKKKQLKLVLESNYSIIIQLHKQKSRFVHVTSSVIRRLNGKIYSLMFIHSYCSYLDVQYHLPLVIKCPFSFKITPGNHMFFATYRQYTSFHYYLYKYLVEWCPLPLTISNLVKVTNYHL